MKQEQEIRALLDELKKFNGYGNMIKTIDVILEIIQLFEINTTMKSEEYINNIRRDQGKGSLRSAYENIRKLISNSKIGKRKLVVTHMENMSIATGFGNMKNANNEILKFFNEYLSFLIDEENKEKEKLRKEKEKKKKVKSNAIVKTSTKTKKVSVVKKKENKISL